jgi:lactate dehydrogenase-like 2-hydroxyacid dehydrogenase
MTPRLLIARPVPDAVLARARQDYEVVLNEADLATDRAQLLAMAQGAAALLVAPGRPFDAAFIDNLPASLRMIATFSVGFDHLDLAAAQARGIVVTNTPDVLTDATADIALLCLLGAARRAWEGKKLLRAGAWTGWTPTQLMGWHLGGKRLGIYGMGRIGQAVADRARAFGMAIHYSNRKRLPDDLEKDAIFHADSDDLLRHSDALSINAPATPETERFLDARRIELLPPNAIVVNTARGTLVDDDALIAALKSRRLFAAGLDVYKGEPKLDPRYLELDNAFLLPHQGSGTVETRNAMGFCCLDNLDAFFAGKAPPNRIA